MFLDWKLTVIDLIGGFLISINPRHGRFWTFLLIKKYEKGVLRTKYVTISRQNDSAHGDDFNGAIMRSVQSEKVLCEFSINYYIFICFLHDINVNMLLVFFYVQ